MNLIDWLHSRFGTKTQSISDPPAWLRAEGVGEQFNIPDRHLPEAQLELYQRLSWVQTAVQQIAQQAAIASFGVMQLAGEKRRKIDNHPFELLLQRPNPSNDSFEFTYATVASYALTGNCYWWLNRANDTAAPDEVWILPPHKVKPVPDGRMFLKGYVYEPDAGAPIPLELHEVVHFKRYHPLNSFIGLSPIEALAITATADMNMQKFGANYFDKGNAKPQGALAFADPIQQAQWDTLKQDIKNNHGGTKREMLMLRGVGTGGVSWLPMALSQQDMQFLESRTFNKEEIFALFAPGLSSMLAVNATEANSLAGKKTFIELAVWPLLVALSKKTTNDVLPAYGPNLAGEFEDIRITDRAMQLQEQQAFAAVHTIDEIREKFYEDMPIGDDRGKLLVAEVGKGLTNTNEPPPPLTPEQQMELAQANKPPGQNQDNNPINSDKPQTEGQIESEEPDEAARDEEAKRFRTWLKKRPKADVTKFKSDILSDLELVGLAVQLKQEVGIDHPPFPGKTTRNRLPGEDGNDEKRAELERYHADKIHAALRRILRAVAPPGTTVDTITPDSAVERYREAQNTLRDALVEMLMDGVQLGADTGIAQVEAILGVDSRQDTVDRKTADLPSTVYRLPTKATITGVNWDLVNEKVLEWVLGTTGGGFGTGYADETLEAMARTSERQIRSVIGEWIGNGLPYRNLIQSLERMTFSPVRAQIVAVTEISRSYAEGTRAAYRQSGVIRKLRWQASNDELMCKYCGHLNGKIIEIDGSFNSELTDELRNELQGRTFQIPPAHAKCRCWITGVPD